MRITVFLLVSSLLAALLALELALDRNTVKIASNTGVQVFTVEIADTDASREHGLMDRRELPEGRGMLFDFFKDQPVGFWMKNTYIPLDMIFIRSDGRIVSIAENTEPMSERVIPSGAPVRAVLEVKGGTSSRLGIQPGDQVANPIFAKAGSAEAIAQNTVRLFSARNAEDIFRRAPIKLKERAKALGY
jgi:uncharacterized protein